MSAGSLHSHDPWHDKPSGPCVYCAKRLATAWWAGESSTMDLIHGAAVHGICAVCAARAQLGHALSFVLKIPQLRDDLERLEKETPVL